MNVLWKFPEGGEELFEACRVSLIPATGDNKSDCNGREHVAFAARSAYGDGTNGWERTMIDTGKVFVMNDHGQTVASYHFKE